MNLRIVVTIPNGVNPNMFPGVRSANIVGKALGAHVMVVSGSEVADNRNNGITINNSIRQTTFFFDKVLITDADVSYNPEHIKMLLDDDLPVVSGLVRNRVKKSMYNCGKWDKLIGVGYCDFYTDKDITGDIMPVDFCTGGLHLIDKHVFQKLEYPYFERMKIIRNDTVHIVNDICGFSVKLYNAGIANNIDTRVRPVHVDLNIKR